MCRRWTKSTGGPSAIARKPATNRSPTTSRTMYRTYRKIASAETVKKTRAICRVVHTGAVGCTRARLRAGPDALAAAAKQAADGREAAADDEARDGRADHDLLAMARDLLAPVRDLGDLAAQPAERQRQLGAV